MWSGQDDALDGLGCPGNTCLGADGHLYAWVEGIDGLGNPVGIWKRIRRGFKRLRRHVTPFIQQVAPYVPFPVAPAAVMPGAPPAQAPMAPEPAAPEAAMAGWGMGADDLDGVAGFGQVGEVAEGPDGNLYEWVQGVDGLGNPVGFWKKLRRRLKRVVRTAMPFARRLAPFVPGAAAALTVATPFLRRAGVAGYGGVDAYQDEELRGLSDDELQGLSADDELLGLADDAMDGLADDELLQGPDDDDLNGIGDDEDLRGFADDEIQGFAADELEGYVRQDGVNGLEAYLPDTPRETPWFKAPAQPPHMWSPLW